MSLIEWDMYFGAGPETFHKARELRKCMTEAELRLWQAIRGCKLGVKFRRQHPIGRFIADFYCHKRRLVIEVDGEYHFHEDQLNYDAGRSDEFSQLVLTTMRFTNDEVMKNLSAVLSKISIEVH